MVAALIMSCKKSKCEEEFYGPVTGAVRASGIALEPIFNTVIGPAGGKFSSKDGKMEIIIPAGAVNVNTSFGIAAISSTSDAAMGRSYRITPHITFNKPVTIKLSWEEFKDSLVSSGCVLGLGFQDPAGVWQLVTKRVVDEEKKTISVQTTHFSDWALLQPFRIVPGYSVISPGEEVILQVESFTRIADQGDPCNFFNTADAANKPITEHFIVPDHWIEKWIAINTGSIGAGILTRVPKGASYRASEYERPQINPVKILAFWFSNKIPLQATIEVRPVDLGVFIEAGGISYVYTNAHVFANSYEDCGLIFEKTVNGKDFHGVINWKNFGMGTRNWSEDNRFTWEPEGSSPPLLYLSTWNDQLNISGGAVNITRIGNVGQIWEGSFNLGNAGQYKAATATTDIEYIGVKQITGRFRVIRKE